MAITPSGVSKFGSLWMHHRVFTSEFVCGMDNPNITGGGTTAYAGDFGRTGGANEGCLSLSITNNNQNEVYDLGLRRRELGSTSDTFNDGSSRYRLMVLMRTELTSITNQGSPTSDRINLFSIIGAGGDELPFMYRGPGTFGQWVMRVGGSAGSTRIQDFLNTTVLIGVDYTPGSEITVWMADVDGDAVLDQDTIDFSWLETNGTKVFEDLSTSENTENGGLRLRCDSAGLSFGGGGLVEHKYRAICYAHGDYPCRLDLTTGLGSMLGITEADDGTWSTGVWVHCPPGRFDSTDSEVWVQLQSSTDGSTFSDIAGAKAELLSARQHTGSLRTGDLDGAVTHTRARFYDGDPDGAGTLIGTGPTLTKPTSRTIASHFCHDHSGIARPWVCIKDAADRGAAIALHMDDFGYPTGQQQDGPQRCVTEDDFREVYLHILHDPYYAEATRSLAVAVMPGDHNSGEDSVVNSDWSSTALVTRWDGTTTAQTQVVLGRALTVWHQLFTSAMPNVQGYSATPSASGLDFHFQWKNAKVYCMENVWRRDQIADSLASNSTTNYGGSSLDQEDAFGNWAASIGATDVPILTTCRVNGPALLATVSDEWFSEYFDGFGRLVAEFDAQSSRDAADALIAVSGDRHYSEINSGLPSPAPIAAEATIGPANTRHFGTSVETTNNGDDTLLAVDPSVRSGTSWARNYGIITPTAAGAASVIVYELGDDGASTEEGSAALISAPPSGGGGGNGLFNPSGSGRTSSITRPDHLNRLPS